MPSKQIPVIDGLFKDTDAGPRLIGSRCSACRTPYFPASGMCHRPGCTGGSLEETEFGPSGKVWSHVRQDFEPPPPVKYDSPFQPYAMAIVDLDDGLRVLGRVIVDDHSDVSVGMAVELAIAPLAHDDEGNEIVCWQFRPA